jgi:hypothetical protein
VNRRREDYEEKVKTAPYDYDAWFDYTRLEEAEGMDDEKTRDIYERAIANVPPVIEKRFWRRYEYIYVCEYMYICFLYIYVCINIYVYRYTYMYKHIHLCMYMYMYIYISVYIHTYISTSKSIHTYI